jgi:hypothetical protein
VDITNGTVWVVVLFFEIIPSVDSTGGTVCVVMLFGIIPSLHITGGTVLVVVWNNTVCGYY